MKRVYIYKRYERFWHWMVFLLVTILALSGFEIHGSYKLMGFQTAVRVHNIALWSFIILIAFTIFWHFTTGEWKQYLPGNGRISVMVKYYTHGIFKNEPHPYKKTEAAKHNPLQRFTYYAILKIILIPAMVLTGLIYYYINELSALGFGGYFRGIAVFHTIGAFALVAFTIVHVYMTTTGHTATSNLEAMITGWEELEVETEENEKEVPKAGKSVPEPAHGD